MSSLEKFKLLLELDKRGAKVRIISVRGEEYICKLYCPAEGEEDLAYHVITLENPPRIFILECDYIDSIEELR